MDFDWLEVPFDLRKVPPREIEETFEDPFSLRLLPEMPSRSGEARYFNLGERPPTARFSACSGRTANATA